MLAVGVSFVALRNTTLYHAQVPTKRDSAAHRDDLILDFLKDIRVSGFSFATEARHLSQRDPSEAR